MIRLVWLAFFLSTLVHGSDISLPKLTVITEDLPPLQITHNNQLVDGIAYQQVQRVLDISELNYNLDVLPWARAFKVATEQPNVLLFSLVRTPEREKHFIWLAQIVDMDLYLVSLKSADINITTLQQARQLLIGVKRHDVVYDYLTGQGFSDQKNLLIMRDTHDTYDGLLRGRVTLAPGNPEVLSAYCKNRTCKTDMFRYNLLIPELRQNFYLAASLGTDPRLLARLKIAIADSGLLVER